MHHHICEQGKGLQQVVRGYFTYHAVPNNLYSLDAFFYHVTRLWMRTLSKAAQSEGCVFMGTDEKARGRMAPKAENSSPLTKRPLCR